MLQERLKRLKLRSSGARSAATSLPMTTGYGYGGASQATRFFADSEETSDSGAATPSADASMESDEGSGELGSWSTSGDSGGDDGVGEQGNRTLPLTTQVAD